MSSALPRSARSFSAFRSAHLPAAPLVRSLAQRIALGPLSLCLTIALRRAARSRPEAFARLGPFRTAAFVIAPAELPFVFVLRPRGADGSVQACAEPEAWDAKVSGPLAVLLGLFDGGMDADAAFFARRIKLEGSTEAMMALRNALETAELDLVDLLPAQLPRRSLLGLGLKRTADAVRSFAGAA